MKYFLGIEIACLKFEIFIFQQKYIHALLKDYGKLACKPANNPIDLNHKLEITKEDTLVKKNILEIS